MSGLDEQRVAAVLDSAGVARNGSARREPADRVHSTASVARSRQPIAVESQGGCLSGDSPESLRFGMADRAEQRARELVDRTRLAMWEADRAILQNGGQVTPELEQRTQEFIRSLVLEMHELIGPSAPLDDSDRAGIGQYLQQAILP